MKTLILALLLTGAAFADTVTDWNAVLRTTVSAQNPPAQARFAAITHLAIFEAVNSITKEYKPYVGMIPGGEGASPEAAAASAAHRVLTHYFPDNAPALNAQRDSSLSMIPDGPAKAAGIAIGEAAAAMMIARRADDGSGTAMPYTPLDGTGSWQPTAPAFAAGILRHWGKVPPFGLARPEQFRSKAPPRLTSTRYARDYNEVKDVGSMLSVMRPEDRATVARYASMTSPVNMWNSVAAQLSVAEGATLSENARAFALLNIGMADAAIAVFEAKYYYNFWRPITAIRNGDIDGNARTAADPSFTTFIATPPYPSYPSGFGALSSAARFVLEDLFGGGGHSITLSLPSLPGVTLEYKRLRQISEDIADARVYAGIHFRFEQEEAELLGQRIAEYIGKHKLRCANRGACEDSGDADHPGGQSEDR